MASKFVSFAGMLLTLVVLAPDRHASAAVKSVAACQATGNRCVHQCAPMMKPREARRCTNTCRRTMHHCVRRAQRENEKRQRDIELGKIKP